MVRNQESHQPTSDAPRPGGLTIPPPPSPAGARASHSQPKNLTIPPRPSPTRTRASHPQSSQTIPPPPSSGGAGASHPQPSRTIPPPLSSGGEFHPQLGRPIPPPPSSAGAFCPQPTRSIPPPPSSTGASLPKSGRPIPPPPSSARAFCPQPTRPIAPPPSSAGASLPQSGRPIPPPPSSGKRFRPKPSRPSQQKNREKAQAELFEHWAEQKTTREMMARQKASDLVPEQPYVGMSDAVMVNNLMLSMQQRNEAAYESPFSPVIRPSDDRAGAPSPSVHSEITNHDSEEADSDASEVLSDAQMPTEQQSENHDAADSAPSLLAPPGRVCDDVVGAENGAQDLSHEEPRPRRGFLGPGNICLDSTAPSVPVKRKRGGPDERRSGSPPDVTAKRPRL